MEVSIAAFMNVQNLIFYYTSNGIVKSREIGRERPLKFLSHNLTRMCQSVQESHEIDEMFSFEIMQVIFFHASKRGLDQFYNCNKLATLI